MVYGLSFNYRGATAPNEENKLRFSHRTIAKIKKVFPAVIINPANKHSKENAS